MKLSHAVLDLLREIKVTAPEPQKHNTTGAIRPTFFRGAAWPEDDVEVKAVEMVPVVGLPAQPPALLSDTLIDEKDACSRLKISESTIKRMRKSGELPFERVGPGKKLVRYRLSVILAKM